MTLTTPACGPALAWLVALLLLTGQGQAAPEGAELCGAGDTDDTLRPIPASLVPAAERIFGLKMPAEQVQRITMFRCTDGHILLCTYGANLPCGKANSDRHPQGAAAWCRDHPNAGFVPSFAIPSGNVYRWRCAAGAPEIVDQIEQIDPRGFVARYWKRLN